MISDVTRRAICALLAADDGITDAERDRVAFALRGGAVGVVAIGEAARRIGRSRPTVWRMVKRGVLRPVYGTGTTRPTGITADSLESFMRGEAVK